MAALTLAYVVTTAVILRATRSAVDEQRLLREEQFRPFVVVDLEHDGERKIVFFRVENVGAMTAQGVKFAISPPFENPKNPELSLDIPLINDGVASLVPGRSIRTFIFVAGDFDPSGVRHAVHVTYGGGDGRRFSEDFVLDFGALTDVRPSTPRGLHSLVDEVEGARKGIEVIAQELQQRDP